MKTASPLQPKSISGTHTSYGHRHFVLFVGHSICRRVRFDGSRGPVKSAFCRSRRVKLVIPEQFTLKTHPVSVGWRRGVNNVHTYSSLQLTLSFKAHTKRAKMHEMYKLFIFVAVLSPVSVGWRREFNNEAHYYSSLQLKLAIKTHTKHAKTHEKIKLFIFAAVLSAAAKLRRLALCVYL